MAAASDALRIAVALIALRHKPAAQSLPSCVLELQSIFQPAEAVVCACDQSWRARVLHLEEEAARLQAQLDIERVRTITLTPLPHPALDSQEAAATGKKKTKKKLDQSSSSKLFVGFQDIFPRMSPMPALDRLFQISSVIIDDRSSSRELFLSVFSAAIEAVSSELGSVVGSRSRFGLESTKAIDVYADVLRHIVSTVLPLRVGHEQLHRTFGVLSKRILQPCLQSFLPLSIRLLAELREGPVSDLRYHLLSLLRTVLLALFSLQPSLTVTSLRMSLVLDTLTELRRTLSAIAASRNEEGKTIWELDLFPGATRGSSAASPPRPHYERHLAKKDAVWFLCAILHLLCSFDGLCVPRFFPSSSTKQEDASGSSAWSSTCEQMRQAIVDDLLQLLSSCGKVYKRASVLGKDGTETLPSNNLRPEAEKGSQHVSHVSQATAVEEELTWGASKVIQGDGQVVVDEAEYAMILGMSERLLLIYAA